MNGIFCDGSCSPNPGPGAWAVIVVKNDMSVKECAGAEIMTTNNRMEFKAILEAIRMATKGDIVYTDSKLAQNTVTTWMQAWKKRGWKKANGKPPENLDLVQQIYEIYSPDTVAVQWVKAHAGDVWNNAVDALANQYRQGLAIHDNT